MKHIERGVAIFIPSVAFILALLAPGLSTQGQVLATFFCWGIGVLWAFAMMNIGRRICEEANPVPLIEKIFVKASKDTPYQEPVGYHTYHVHVRCGERISCKYAGCPGPEKMADHPDKKRIDFINGFHFIAWYGTHDETHQYVDFDSGDIREAIDDAESEIRTARYLIKVWEHDSVWNWPTLRKQQRVR